MSTNLPPEQIVIAALHDVISRGYVVGPSQTWGVRPSSHGTWAPDGDPICAIGAVLLVMQPCTDIGTWAETAAVALGTSKAWTNGVSCGFEDMHPSVLGPCSDDNVAGYEFGQRLRKMVPSLLLRYRQTVTPV